MSITNTLIPIAQIAPHPRNYRSHPDTQLAQLGASYARFGQFRSVVVVARSDGTYTQVAGHGIVEAMKRNGATEVRVDVLSADTSPEDIEAILIADNTLGGGASDDEELLATMLKEQQDAGFDLAAMGGDDETLRQMLSELGDAYLGDDTDGDDEEDTLPEDVEPRAKLGDVWQLGRHKIACMSSTNEETYTLLFRESTPQMIWSDPPYGISIVATNVSVGGGEAYDIPFGGVKNRAHGDVGGSASHIRKTGKSYIAEWNEKKNGLASKRLGTSNGSKPFGSKSIKGSIGGANPPGSKNNLKIAPTIQAGKYAPVIGDETTATAIDSFLLCAEYFPGALHIWWGANYYADALPPSKCWIVWDKENTGNFADAELAWCSDDSAVRIFKHMWNGLMKASEQGQRRIHPTQKPVKLAEWAFEKYGKDNDIIFDPFLGSGMSVIAAENLNRTVIGCELSPEYIDKIIARWESHTGQTAVLLAPAQETVNA